MVACLIRLKLALLRNSFRRSVWQVVGTSFGLLYGLFLVMMVVVLQFMVGGDPGSLEPVMTASVLLGSGALLVWLLVPLFFSGGDSIMDPRQFVTYAVPRTHLVAGLVLAAMIGTGSVLTVPWLAGQILLWRSEPAAVVVALLSAPLLLLLFSASSQAVTTAVSAWFSGRRVRDIAVMAAFALGMMVYPVALNLGEYFDSWEELIAEVANTLAWTPLGAGAALPGDAAQAEWGLLALRLVIVFATLGAALLVTRAALVKVTERPSLPRVRRAAASGRLGPLGMFPATSWGAVAGRCLIYWFKDARYGASIVLIPALVVMMVVFHLQSGQAWMLYGLGPLIAWALGLTISADISYDNTAFALHVTSGLDGMADRLGRAVALCTFAVPLILLGTTLPLIFTGNAEHLMVLTFLSLGMLLTFVGSSSFASARMTYPVPKPGENPFRTPPGASGRLMLVQFVSFFVITVLMLPEVTLLIIWAVTGVAWLGPLTAVFGLIKGVLLLWAGIRLGAKVYDRSQPELFQQVSEYA